MKRTVCIVLALMGTVLLASAQRDDLYFVPKKKKVEVQTGISTRTESKRQAVVEETAAIVSSTALGMNEDAYNRRWSYQTEDGRAVSELAKAGEGFLLITGEGDTVWTTTDTLRITRVANEEGWVNGFSGSDSDYEYAMRIIRFRNPRYAIPVSSPIYWDVVYGNSLWPSWEWNIYDDGLYAYVFPTSSNWYYWDYWMSYPFGWSSWGNPWAHHHSVHWGHHWSGHYGWKFHAHVWNDPWFNPNFHHCYPGWHAGHHHGHYPGFGVGKPEWGGRGPKAFPNHRTTTGTATRRDTQTGSVSSRRTETSGSSRTGATTNRSGNGSTHRVNNGSSRNSSVRVGAGSSSRPSGTVRSSGSSRIGNEESPRRSTGSSSVEHRTATRSSSRSGYTRQSSSRSSNSSSSYNRPSSTRSSSSSSSVNRNSSSSSSSRSSSSSSSSRSSSYSSGSSYSGGSRSSSSYSGGSSRSSSGSSRSSGSRR